MPIRKPTKGEITSLCREIHRGIALGGRRAKEDAEDAKETLREYGIDPVAVYAEFVKNYKPS